MPPLEPAHVQSATFPPLIVDSEVGVPEMQPSGADSHTPLMAVGGIELVLNAKFATTLRSDVIGIFSGKFPHSGLVPEYAPLHEDHTYGEAPGVGSDPVKIVCCSEMPALLDE